MAAIDAWVLEFRELAETKNKEGEPLGLVEDGWPIQRRVDITTNVDSVSINNQTRWVQIVNKSTGPLHWTTGASAATAANVSVSVEEAYAFGVKRESGLTLQLYQA